MRAARNTARRAQAARSTRRPVPSTPATRARHATRRATRTIARGWRSGVAIGKKYTRLTDPAHTPRHAKGTPAKKSAPAKKTTPPTGSAAKPGKAVTPPTTTTAAPKTTKKTTPKNTTGPKPGRPIPTPGHTQKAPTMTTTAPGVSAVVEAVREHIAGFQPENAFDIVAFFSGLHELFGELGQSLTVVAQRMADEEPIDVSVTQHLEQMAGHTASLGEWATQTEGLFRRAHEVEIARIENPRHNEEHWDLDRNR